MTERAPATESQGAVMMYMPALHAGYLKFIEKQAQDNVYLLDEDLLKEVPALERDVRAVQPAQMTEALQAVLAPSQRRVQLLGKRALGMLPDNMRITMPDEEISHEVAENHLELHTVTFEPVFLRWDRQITAHEHIISPDRTVSVEDFDREAISIARKAAEKSPDWWRQVGAAIAKDGEITYVGYNEQMPCKDYGINTFGDPKSNFGPGEAIELSKSIHAEASLIAQAAKEGTELEGSSMYVTTFPCPACARLLSTAGINKVYYQDGYSVMDAEDVLKAADIEIVRVVPDED